MTTQPSPEAIKMLQAFFLSRGKVRQVTVTTLVSDPGFSDQRSETFHLKLTSGQIGNLRELLAGLQQETRDKE